MFVGVSKSGCGNAQIFCLSFHFYLNNNVSKSHFENVIYDSRVTGPNILCKVFVISHYQSLNYDHPEVYHAYSRQIESGNARKYVWCMCGVCVGVSGNMDVSGSRCGKVRIFRCFFRLIHLYICNHSQASHFENYESVCYVNMATAIHIN